MTNPQKDASGVYQFDPGHTTVLWQCSHFGFSKPKGIFTSIEGTLDLDAVDPENSQIRVTIPLETVTTGNKQFDDHLKSKEFFDIEQYPKASFESEKVEVTGKDSGRVYGILTLHGVSKPVILEVTFNKIGENPIIKKPTVGFSATTTILRSDFGMKTFLPGIGDEVNLNIEAEANKP